MKTQSSLPNIQNSTSRSVQRYFIAKTLVPEAKETIDSNNIFQEVDLERNTDKGPRTDHKGDLIKYTICGKVDWFNKIKNGKKA